MDLRARYRLARSQLESGRDRSRTMRPTMRPVPRRALRLLILIVGILGIPMAVPGQERPPIVFPNTQYEPVDWTNLDGWESDDHVAAFAAFLASCRTLEAKHRRERDLTAIP